MILEKYGGIDHNCFGFDDRLSETHDISNNISNEVYFAVLYTADLPEINKGGPKRCPCGSGKPPESCCFKHLRPDKNPNSMVEEFKIEHEDIDTYDIPQSHKAYEKHKKDEETSKEEEGEVAKEVESEWRMLELIFK